MRIKHQRTTLEGKDISVYRFSIEDHDKYMNKDVYWLTWDEKGIAGSCLRLRTVKLIEAGLYKCKAIFEGKQINVPTKDLYIEV